MLVLLALVVVVLLAKNRPTAPEREVTTAAMLVDVVEAERSSERFKVSAQGTVRPRTQTNVAAEVSGRIVALSDQFVAGGFFRAGEVLVEIDPSDYEAALLQAEADLAAARARLSEEQARSDQARQDFARLHGPDREPGELVVRLPQVAGARAAVQAAEAAVLRAERNLERTRIRLPYDGMVRSRQADLGQFVSPGTVLGVTFAVDTAEIRLPVPDQDMAFLDLRPALAGHDAQARAVLTGSVAGQFGQWEGVVVRTEGVIDESTRLNFVVVSVDDPYGLLGVQRDVPLVMGSFVNARVEGRATDGLIVLPREALREDNSIYLVDEQSALEIRSVDVVRSTPRQVYVRNKLQPGDPVITTAIQTPIPGLPLRVRERPALDSTEPQLRLLPTDELAGLPEARQ